MPHSVRRSPQKFYEMLVRERVTVLNQTPSAFLQLCQVDKKSTREVQQSLALRPVIFGGEVLDIASLGQWFQDHGNEQPRQGCCLDTNPERDYTRLFAAARFVGSYELLGPWVEEQISRGGGRRISKLSDTDHVAFRVVDVLRPPLHRVNHRQREIRSRLSLERNHLLLGCSHAAVSVSM